MYLHVQYVCMHACMCQGKRVLHRVSSGVQGQFRIIVHRIFRDFPLYNASTYYHYYYHLSISAAPSQWQHQVQCIPSDMSENRPERGHAGGRPLLAIETQHQNRPQLRRPGRKNSRHIFIHTNISYRTNIQHKNTCIHTYFKQDKHTYNIYIHKYFT